MKPELSEKGKLIGLIVASVVFMVGVILNYYLREGLFLLGIKMISNMQQNSSGFLDFLENVFSLLGHPIAIYSIIAVQWMCVKQRIRTLVHLSYIMIGIYFMIVLKQAFQESRPFWFNSSIRIIEWFCPTDFGNPSGHSFIVFAMYEPLISDFIGTNKKKYLLFIWVLLAVLTVISRMYLGAHSFDQVVFGSLIGLSFLVMYRFWLQEFLYDTYRQLLNQRGRLLVGVITAALWVIFVILPIAIYELNSSQRPVDDGIINTLNQQCNNNKTFQDYQRGILYSCIAPFLPFGFIIGFIFLKNKEKQDTFFMAGLWNYTNNLAIVKYILAVLVVSLPSVVFILLIPKAISNAQGAFLLKVIGATWSGFGLVMPMGVLQKKFGIIRLHPNDYTQ